MSLDGIEAELSRCTIGTFARDQEVTYFPNGVAPSFTITSKVDRSLAEFDLGGEGAVEVKSIVAVFNPTDFKAARGGNALTKRDTFEWEGVRYLVVLAESFQDGGYRVTGEAIADIEHLSDSTDRRSRGA